jgi:hypothetical protein
VAGASSTGVALGVSDDSRVRTEIETVLASDTLRRSPKVSRLLRYLCDKQLDGRGDQITEYGIAIEVLGRDEQFDPQQDALVRVNLLHLRKKLKEYYAGAGVNHDVRIVIPNGQYAPQFLISASVAAPAGSVEISTPPETSRVPIGSSFGWRWWLTALVPVLLAIFWILPRFQPPARHPEHAAVVASSDEIRIAAGNRTDSYVDSSGHAWLPDRYFTGGTTFRRPAIHIQRASDTDLFLNGREGQFEYAIPLRPGTYELHLYFAETGVSSDTVRSVNIALNGRAVPSVDIAADAGGVNTATMKVFCDLAPAKDGLLHIAFQGGSNFLNAIEILPGLRGRMRPLRITTRDGTFHDHLGQVWSPERWSVGGRKSDRQVSIEETQDSGLYQWQRFGHFNYSIPVQESRFYTVTLHFSETWFKPGTLGGVGSRIFDVYCNGTTLLKNFDILKEAGGLSNHAVVRIFRHIPASPLGKLDLTFVPVANYALINAIEVESE